MHLRNMQKSITCLEKYKKPVKFPVENKPYLIDSFLFKS